MKQENRQECREQEMRASYFFQVFQVCTMWCSNPLFIWWHWGIQRDIINMVLTIKNMGENHGEVMEVWELQL